MHQSRLICPSGSRPGTNLRRCALTLGDCCGVATTCGGKSSRIAPRPQRETPCAGHGLWLPAKSRTIVLKVPYMVLTGEMNAMPCARLDFDRERTAVAGYWRRQLDRSARLITPEPMLNEFYRSHAMHLLVNCEREPESDRRFARVGSFGYGAYGNESCMMVVDLDRRGYHKEAQDCLDAWLQYQGTVRLPGSFASQEGRSLRRGRV